MTRTQTVDVRASKARALAFKDTLPNHNSTTTTRSVSEEGPRRRTAVAAASEAAAAQQRRAEGMAARVARPARAEPTTRHTEVKAEIKAEAREAAAGRRAAGTPDPVTPTAGTKYSFGAAVRARGSGGSAASDVSSVSAGSWQRNVSPVRQPTPPTSPGGRGRTTTGRGDLDGDGGGALPPRDPTAPTVHEEILQVKRQSAQALVASARAQADLARTSAAVNSAAVVKLAKDTVSHECQLYESRRFVASSGGSNIGWDNVVATIGDEGSSDALNKLSVLGANNDGAAARAELRLATPAADSVAKTPGGLFLAYGIGTGWFKQVADAVRDRDTARVRYGIRFVVTFRAIEAFCRVELGAPEGLTPEWCAFQTDDVLEVAADLATRARREGEPPAINDIAAYKKACLAMGTFMAVTYGKIVSDRWTEYVKEVALLGSTFKWTLAYRKYLINAALTAFSDAVQASIDAVKAVNAAANDLAGVGSEANDPSVTDLVAMYGRVGVGGAPIFTKPEAAAFSTDHDHKTAPLASALRKLRAIMAKEAQKGLMNGAVNVALAAQSGAAFGNETASRRRQREKEEKRAASDAASKDPPTRGKGQQAPADDDTASNVDSTPPDTRGSGEAVPWRSAVDGNWRGCARLYGTVGQVHGNGEEGLRAVWSGRQAAVHEVRDAHAVQAQRRGMLLPSQEATTHRGRNCEVAPGDSRLGHSLWRLQIAKGGATGRAQWGHRPHDCGD